MKAPRTLIGRGAVAGMVGATALALWFLVIDAVNGQPFQTPLFLASLLGLDVTVGAAVVIIYTLVHFAAFIAVGIAVAVFVERFEVVPAALLGVVLGFVLFDLLFYGSVLVTGVDVVDELGWPQALIGNIIAGIALFGALAAMGAVESVSWREMLAQHVTIREGLITGLIGAGAVALWFLAVDALAGRVLFTPAALGSALFHGARSPDQVQMTADVVLGYTVIHIGAFLLTGLIAAVLVAAAEQISEALLLGAVLLFVTFEAFSIGILAIVFSWLVDALSWWNVAGANLVAAIAMGGYLLLQHPQLLRDVQERDLEEDMAQDVPARHLTRR
ncbi:MAG TPA: hypothetical protein VMN60_13230 [Longimicrobiales bacterium]|nr:hypothetical protein [Longimicrobiales bacterium]